MLDEFIISRIEAAKNSLVSKNDFLKERDNFDTIISKLEDTLNSEQCDLLEKVLSSKNLQSQLTCQACYYRGFSDCIKVVAYGKLD